jgi:integrase
MGNPVPIRRDQGPCAPLGERSWGTTRTCRANAAPLSLKAHPHMLRHACGCALANKGLDTRAIQGWLGHRSITSTAVFTALALAWVLDNVASSRSEHRGPPKPSRQIVADRLQDGP